MTHLAHNANPNLPAFEKFGRTINPSDDPTKTAGLRARWVREVRKRWSVVQRFVRQSVVSEDFFGLRRDTPPGNPSQQIERFMAALVRVENASINEEKNGFIPWITPFVGEGFGKGMIRGNRDLAALARGQKREIRTETGNVLRLMTNQELFEAPTLDPDNLQDALQAGERARLFELEVTRTWQGITGVTAQVNGQVAQVIAAALETRATPRQLAKDINERIDKVGKTRAEMIARTETVAANNRGAVAEFAEAQRLTGFEVHVQWETSLDSRVRDTHIVRHGDVYTKQAGLGLISEPNCRCALLPYIPAIEGDVDLSSGKAAKALTPDEAKARAERERKKLDVPAKPTGKPVKRRKKPSPKKQPIKQAPKEDGEPVIIKPREKGEGFKIPKDARENIGVIEKAKQKKKIVPLKKSTKTKLNTEQGTLVRRGSPSIEQNRRLTADEQSYIEYYKGDGFHKTNQILRNPKAYSADEVNHAILMRESIDSAVRKHTIQNDGVVYRGISNGDIFDNAESLVGQNIPIRTPQSTSTDPRMASQWSGAHKTKDGSWISSNPGESVVFEIKTKSGQKAIDLENFQAGGRSSEQEILFASGGHYRVTGVRELKNKNTGDVVGKVLEVEYVE